MHQQLCETFWLLQQVRSARIHLIWQRAYTTLCCISTTQHRFGRVQFWGGRFGQQSTWHMEGGKSTWMFMIKIFANSVLPAWIWSQDGPNFALHVLGKHELQHVPISLTVWIMFAVQSSNVLATSSPGVWVHCGRSRFRFVHEVELSATCFQMCGPTFLRHGGSNTWTAWYEYTGYAIHVFKHLIMMFPKNSIINNCREFHFYKSSMQLKRTNAKGKDRRCVASTVVCTKISETRHTEKWQYWNARIYIYIYISIMVPQLYAPYQIYTPTRIASKPQ